MGPLLLPLIIPLLAGAAARPLAHRLEPRQATWLLCAAAVVLAGCAAAALALAAGFAAARLPVLAALGDYSLAPFSTHNPVPVAGGIGAALALAGAAVAVTARSRHRVRALLLSYRRAARLNARDGIVVLPGPDLDAYALPGWPGRIVVSGGLLDLLEPRRRAALIAHERAHLAGRHHLFTITAWMAAAACPLLIPVARAVEFTVERWADEEAAAATGDRRLVAETIGQVAVMTAARGAAQGTARSALRLGMTGPARRRPSVAWAGPVPRRVAALLAAPPRTQRRVLLAACTAVVLLAGLAVLDAARDLHALLELAQAGR
ncbi:MAG TPA: M56 family metallopeptidase [Streptosporangiaceae bacterium]